MRLAVRLKITHDVETCTLLTRMPSSSTVVAVTIKSPNETPRGALDPSGIKKEQWQGVDKTVLYEYHHHQHIYHPPRTHTHTHTKHTPTMQNQHGQGASHAAGDSKVPAKIQEQAPASLEKNLPNKVCRVEIPNLSPPFPILIPIPTQLNSTQLTPTHPPPPQDPRHGLLNPRPANPHQPRQRRRQSLHCAAEAAGEATREYRARGSERPA